MNVTGVIAEFDPFHSGHAYLLETARRETDADAVVCVMSGSFTQRGRAAALDKWTRAEQAVQGGADAVFELPAACACASAQFFAYGGIRVLSGLGCVNALAFGSESGDKASIENAAAFLEENRGAIEMRIAELVRCGTGYPAAREQAVREMNPSFDVRLLSEPNDILAIEYARAVRRLASQGESAMRLCAVKRIGGGDAETSTRLRQELRARDPERYANADRRFFDLLRFTALRMDPEQIDRISGASSGLGRKLLSEIVRAKNLQDLEDRVASRGYTRSRVRRLFVQTVLGIRRGDEKGARPVLRLLAAGPEGRKLIRTLKDEAMLRAPFVTNINRAGIEDPDRLGSLRLDVLASDVRNLLFGEDLYVQSDHVCMPRMIAGEVDEH